MAGDIGPRKGIVFNGVGPREGVGDGLEEFGSAPDQRKPSKRPDVRISHSDTLILDMVARRLCNCGCFSRYIAASGSLGGEGSLYSL